MNVDDGNWTVGYLSHRWATTVVTVVTYPTTDRRPTVQV